MSDLMSSSCLSICLSAAVFFLVVLLPFLSLAALPGPCVSHSVDVDSRRDATASNCMFFLCDCCLRRLASTCLLFDCCCHRCPRRQCHSCFHVAQQCASFSTAFCRQWCPRRGCCFIADCVCCRSLFQTATCRSHRAQARGKVRLALPVLHFQVWYCFAFVAQEVVKNNFWDLYVSTFVSHFFCGCPSLDARQLSVSGTPCVWEAPPSWKIRDIDTLLVACRAHSG